MSVVAYTYTHSDTRGKLSTFMQFIERSICVSIYYALIAGAFPSLVVTSATAKQSHAAGVWVRLDFFVMEIASNKVSPILPHDSKETALS